ncbi:transposase [Moorena sp. SIO1G6]|uniref:transposase n=1 Tax=Moorena sp. SIO1G6 TaxID=2607840 RepID=UPI00257E15D4|nr:transposase [Moorena sp. SIO1G6]
MATRLGRVGSCGKTLIFCGASDRFFYEFSNYGSYEKLTTDGLTQWHPAFLKLGHSLDECARKYRGFCNRYKPKSKPARKCHWGNKFLAGIQVNPRTSAPKPPTLGALNPGSPQTWGARGARGCQVKESPEVYEMKFIEANQAPWQAKHDVKDV